MAGVAKKAKTPMIEKPSTSQVTQTETIFLAFLTFIIFYLRRGQSAMRFLMSAESVEGICRQVLQTEIFCRISDLIRTGYLTKDKGYTPSAS